MDYHKWLYRTRWLMKEVECAVCNLSEHIVSDGALPNLFYSGESDAATIILKSDEMRQKLRGVYYRMADEWTVICGNEVKRREAAIHLRDYNRLKSRFRELTALVGTDPSLNIFLFNDGNLLQRPSAVSSDMTRAAISRLYFHSRNLPSGERLPGVSDPWPLSIRIFMALLCAAAGSRWQR